MAEQGGASSLRTPLFSFRALRLCAFAEDPFELSAINSRVLRVGKFACLLGSRPSGVWNHWALSRRCGWPFQFQFVSFEEDLNPFNRALEKAPAQFDIAQNMHFNAIYRLPDLTGGPGAIRYLLDGWSASGILTLQTGLAFTPEIQTNRSRSLVGGGTNTDRPDVTPGYNLSNATNGTTAGCPGVAAGQKLGTPNLWYDPCAFTLQPAGFLGDASRNLLRGPGISTLHFSLMKDMAIRRLGEGGKLEFRVEAFNILNHANFGTPLVTGTTPFGANTAATVFAGNNGSTALPTAGVLTTTNTTSRQIQFGLKIVF